ncbi:MAG: FAD-dependent oxidoreductase [Pseudomonadota bacterium]|nr:FAD-dependent oxidoreductase [Pseudomonadota bacterium]
MDFEIEQMQTESLSLWMDTVEMPGNPTLTENLKTDVCIVGGGLGGLTTAYLLMKEGKSVCVLEDSEIGSGQTGRTTAHFVTALDDRYFDLEKYHGESGARLAAESHRAALEEVENIIAKEKIECDLEYVDGFLFAAAESPPGVLNDELLAAHRAGLSEVNMVSRAPLESFNTGPALCFPRQLQLNPLKYLKGLAECLLKNGGKIYTNTHVLEVHGGKDAFVKTKNGNIVKAQSIVVATNTPINNLFAIHTKQAAYRTYVIALLVPRGHVAKGLYWDTLDPYHYVRVESSKSGTDDILIVGGEDHKTGQNNKPEESFSRLEKWTREKFPLAKKIAYRWSGQVMEPVDGLGFLGHNPMDRNNVYVITGDSGNGMTHCTIGGLLIADQIMDIKNPWERLYSPSRISLRATGTYLRENANMAAQFGDWFTGKQLEELEDISPGEGAVFRNGLKQVAAYKSKEGILDLRSAVCPHLGCVVSWNSVEKSWDCPCHGSRFNCHGKVLEGPAVTDLKKVAEPVLNNLSLERKVVYENL